MADAPPPRKPPTLAHVMGTLVFASGFLAVLTIVMLPGSADELDPQSMHAGEIILGVAWGAAHAVVISTDIQRRGKKVGIWRFVAFFLAVPTALFYLAAAYKLRALYLAPAYLFLLILTFIPWALFGVEHA